MVDIAVIAEYDRDDTTSSLTPNTKPERLYLRHESYSNIIDNESRYTSSSLSLVSTGSYEDIHSLFVATTTAATTNHLEQEHRSLRIQHLRGLGNGNANTTNDESVYLSDDTESESLNAGTIISILLCILIIVLFIWLGYCVCWFSYGG